MSLGFARAMAVVLCLLVACIQPATTAAAKSGLVDINSATIAELKTLPGIRDAYAAAIVRNRPYDNKSQLLSRKILPVATYRQIRDKIVAKQ